MTKKEVVWLLIRMFGVYFAYLAIVSLFAVFAVLPSLIFTPVINSPANANTQIPATKVQPVPFNGSSDLPNEPVPDTTSASVEPKENSEAVKTFLWYILLTFIYGAVGWYLLRDGRLFYFLLMREEVIKKSEPEPEVTSLNL